MKYILTKTNNQTLGPFINVEKFDNGYMCDDVFIETIVSGEVVLSEVSDDYINPEVIKVENEKFNKNQAICRVNSYREFSDPLFFKAQRGEVTIEEWQAKVEEIKTRFPYKE